MNTEAELFEIDKRVIEIRGRVTFFWQFYVTYAFFALGYLVTGKKPGVEFDVFEKIILTSFHFTFVFMNIMALYPRYAQLYRISNLLSGFKEKLENHQYTMLVLDELNRTLRGDLIMKKLLWLIHAGASLMILYLLWR